MRLGTAAINLAKIAANRFAPISVVLKYSGRQDEIRGRLCSHFAGRGYEIGAGARPTLLPARCRVTYVDRFTYDEAKDGSFVAINSSHLVPVSIYEAMDDLRSIPDGSADFFVANHVIEHVPNVIPAIANVCRKLRLGGSFFLTIPHKEFMFDHLREVTTLDHLIADAASASPDLTDHYREYSRLSKKMGNWEEDALEMEARGADFHAHVFTPESFRQLLRYLQDQGMFSAFEVIVPTRAPELIEFYARIRK